MIIQIFITVIFPIFFLIALGVLIERLLKPDLNTLFWLVLNIFLPAMVFLKLVEGCHQGGQLLALIGFNLLHFAVFAPLVWLFFSLPAYRQMRSVTAMSVMFTNSGIYGLPFLTLAFGAAALNAGLVAVLVQAMLNFTIGLWVADSDRASLRESLKLIARTPIVYAILLGAAACLAGVQLSPALRAPLDLLVSGLVPVSLITLGVQLARSQAFGQIRHISLAVFLRLILSPLLAAGLFWLWQHLFADGLTGQGLYLIATAGYPTALNVSILGATTREKGELGSQIVFWTTLLSTITLSILIGVFG